MQEPDKFHDDILTFGRTLELANIKALEMECETSFTEKNAKQNQRVALQAHKREPQKQPKHNARTLIIGNLVFFFPHRQRPCHAKLCRRQTEPKNVREIHDQETRNVHHSAYDCTDSSSENDYPYSLNPIDHANEHRFSTINYYLNPSPDWETAF